MRDQSEVPAEFVSYVDGRLPALEAAAHRLTGDDLQAERLCQDLLTLVALRWRRLSRADTQDGVEPGESADVYLTRLFRQEAFDQGAQQVPLRLDVPVPRRRYRAGRLTPTDEAGLIWERARRTIRRRLLIGAGAAGVLAVIAVCQRGKGGDTASSETTEVRPTTLPSGAELGPDKFGALVSIPGVPPQIAVPTGDFPLLTADPVRRAMLLMAVSRTDTSPIVVLGDDGRWRKVNLAPALTALWLHAGALSPDGLRAAFGTSTGTTVVDLTTGQAQEYSATPEPTRPVWLGPRHLVLGVKNLLDVTTGQTSAFPTRPDDVLTPRHADPVGDPATRLIELLSVGEPATAAARIRRWTQAGTEVVTQLNGPLAELIGPWRGGGFGYGGDDGLLARLCMTTAAYNVGAASAVVAVIRPKTARVERTLLIDPNQSGSVRLLGFADEKHVLLSLVVQGAQQVVSWDLAAGGVNLAATVQSEGVIAFPDLTSAA
jgi:hypothetical protein